MRKIGEERREERERERQRHTRREKERERTEGAAGRDLCRARARWRGAENWVLVGVMETSRIMTGCLAPRPR